MKEVNVELYEMLKDRECHLNYNPKGYYMVTAWVRLYHWDIKSFCEIVGPDYFSVEGVDCILKYDYIVVELSDIIEEWFEHKLSSYANCFEEWDDYKDKILEQESE